MKIAILAMRPDKSKYYYDGVNGPHFKRMTAWLEQTMIKHRDAEFLLPVANVFDYTALSYAVEHKLKATLYLPSADWGSELPLHRRSAMSCIQALSPSVICDGQMARTVRMFEDADVLLIVTDKTDSFINQFIGYKPTIWFPWPQFVAGADLTTL